jgi:hypothetical protein
MGTTDEIRELMARLSDEDRYELLAEVGRLGMSSAQYAALEAGEIERMRIGVFRCSRVPAGRCRNERLWEAPVEGRHRVSCPECGKPAVLVELVWSTEPGRF